MCNKYVTIGIGNSDIHYIKYELEKVLQISFHEHESSYKGIYFLCKLFDSEKIELGSNFQDGAWREEEHKECSLLLEISGFKNVEEVINKILQNISSSYFIKAIEVKTGIGLRVYNFENRKFKLISEKYLKKDKS